eukprot:scaffold14916_cov128-Isochrysis_galbana.AAC.6
MPPAPGLQLQTGGRVASRLLQAGRACSTLSVLGGVMRYSLLDNRTHVTLRRRLALVCLLAARR